MSSFRRNIMMFTRPVESQGVPVPTISPASGSILSPQTISISITGTATGAEYSINNTNWTTYVSPFTIASSTTIYARAYDGDGNYSSVVSETYTILPYDAEVEYLETNGTQYIDTGYSPSSITPIIETIIYKPTTSSGYYVLGADGSGNTRFSLAFFSDIIEPRIGVYSDLQGYSKGQYIIKLDGSNGEYYINNVKKGTSSNRTFTSTMNILLFTSYNQSNEVRPILSGVRISSFKLWNGTTLIRDLIPVRKNNVGYFYDNVSGTLLSNEGTGSFVYGELGSLIKTETVNAEYTSSGLTIISSLTFTAGNIYKVVVQSDASVICGTGSFVSASDAMHAELCYLPSPYNLASGYECIFTPTSSGSGRVYLSFKTGYSITSGAKITASLYNIVENQ